MLFFSTSKRGEKIAQNTFHSRAFITFIFRFLSSLSSAPLLLRHAQRYVRLLFHNPKHDEAHSSLDSFSMRFISFFSYLRMNERRPVGVPGDLRLETLPIRRFPIKIISDIAAAATFPHFRSIDMCCIYPCISKLYENEFEGLRPTSYVVQHQFTHSTIEISARTDENVARIESSSRNDGQ